MVAPAFGAQQRPMNEATRVSLRLFALLAAALGGSARALKVSTFGSQPGAPYRQVLRNRQNAQYVGDLLIGGQTISGLFDTGSVDLLVRSTRCHSCVHPTAPYNRTSSDTYETWLGPGTIAETTFGSGPCTSVRGYETVGIGPLVAENQAFYEIVQHQIPVLDIADFAAIVGMGPNFLGTTVDPSLLMSFNVTEFSLCLGRPSLSPGYLTLGREAEAEYKEQHYAQADARGLHHWATPMGSVRFMSSYMTNQEVVVCPNEGCGVIVDSGTSLIAAPGEVLAQLATSLTPIMEDCSNLHMLPALKFTMDGTEFVLPPEAYTMRITGAVMEADSIWDILFFKPRIRRINMCIPAFMQIDLVSQFGPTWILGMPFFRYYHTTFDRTARKMYFAHAGPGCAPRPFYGNASEPTLASWDAELHKGPMEMDVKAMVPPALLGKAGAAARVVHL